VRKKLQTADSPVSWRIIRSRPAPSYTKIGNFLLGKMNEQDLLAEADSVEEKKRPEQQGEA